MTTLTARIEQATERVSTVRTPKPITIDNIKPINRSSVIAAALVGYIVVSAIAVAALAVVGLSAYIMLFSLAIITGALIFHFGEKKRFARNKAINAWAYKQIEDSIARQEADKIRWAAIDAESERREAARIARNATHQAELELIKAGATHERVTVEQFLRHG